MQAKGSSRDTRANEVQRPIAVLGVRARTLVLLAFGTGYGWVNSSVSSGTILTCRKMKSASRGPSCSKSLVLARRRHHRNRFPSTRLAESLKIWHHHTTYRKADDWVFASPAARGQRPYWGQCLMRTIIRPAAAKIGITQRIGWHTFRHTYSSLLRANKTDIKVTQELLRHASSRVTLDTYTQAVTVQKRRAQSSVIRLLQASATAVG